LKQGLKVTEDQYLNMDQIVEWMFSDNGIYIYFNPRTEIGICITTDATSAIGWDCRVVAINEFHRIKREMSEYMGVGPQEHLSRVK